MARNVEIKARVGSVDAIAPRAAALAQGAPVEIEQDDTFFRCEHGRLKLRKFSDGLGELIFYRRDDLPGPKPSFYLRSPTSAPDTMRESLALAWGTVGRVRKRRTLYLAGRTRIHLDRVEGLGEFVELEVVLGDDEPLEAGVEEAHAIMRGLGIEPGQLVEGAYVDLLRARSPRVPAQGPGATTAGRAARLAPVWASGLAALALFAGLAVYLAPLEPGVVALQFTFSPRAFATIVHAWPAEDLARYRAHLPVDVALLLAYGAFGFLLATRTGVFAGAGPRARAALAWAMPLAAAFDAAENGLHAWLTAAPRFGAAQAYAIAGACSSAKWALLAAFALGVALALGRRALRD